MWKIPSSTNIQSRLALCNTIRKLTALWEWGGSAGTLTTTIHSMHWNMALDLHRASLPFLSVLASPGILHSSRAGAAPGVPPAQSAAWRVQPPWVSLAGHRPRTKGRWVIRGVTRLPRWDSAVAIIQQLAAVACCVWGSYRRVVVQIKNRRVGDKCPWYRDVYWAKWTIVQMSRDGIK